MFTLVLMSLSWSATITPLTGYESLDACNRARDAFVAEQRAAYGSNLVKAFCIPGATEKAGRK